MFVTGKCQCLFAIGRIEELVLVVLQSRVDEQTDGRVVVGEDDFLQAAPEAAERSPRLTNQLRRPESIPDSAAERSRRPQVLYRV